MTVDEGYIKFASEWERGDGPDAAAVAILENWRRPLFEAGLIGYDDELGVGYGNISVRIGGNQFAISGTQTGHLAVTTAAHYALVTSYDIDGNRVRSIGQTEASSESMTHAAIYALDNAINAVVHVHSRDLWDTLRGRLPTTSAQVGYGTPEMAHEFERLYRDTEFASTGVAIMGGHDAGILSFGRDLEEAARRVLALAAG